ncbi:TlyA family RNA methyltransferase [Jutongia sp.]|uniref:TlyA family RNA methyltransferase n=1 Tax=Jutongia sp. TaxID=2944204 RepID=UPI003079CC1E
MVKERLDVLLVKRNLAASREKAKAIIMTGNVFVNGQREDKAGSTFKEDALIEVKGNPMKYVSRGGYKLEKAIDLWQVPLQDKICMDVGSSTGGFTDCMLQNGAQKVYAIDVGTNQLAWKLRQDERVISMEKTNIRYVTREDIADFIDFFSVDVAFISLKKVLEPVKALLTQEGQGVCLVKPQFEAGREKVGKKGVVRDPKVHREVLEQIMQYVLSIGFEILELSFSPIKGPEGNIEYLLYIQNTDRIPEGDSLEESFHVSYDSLIRETVAAAHGKLDKDAEGEQQ